MRRKIAIVSTVAALALLVVACTAHRNNGSIADAVSTYSSAAAAPKDLAAGASGLPSPAAALSTTPVPAASATPAPAATAQACTKETVTTQPGTMVNDITLHVSGTACLLPSHHLWLVASQGARYRYIAVSPVASDADNNKTWTAEFPWFDDVTRAVALSGDDACGYAIAHGTSDGDNHVPLAATLQSHCAVLGEVQVLRNS